MLSIFIAALLSVLLAQAPLPKPGVIEGTVTRSGSSAPIADATVLLPAGEFGPRRTTTTDGNGHFEFADVAPGIYAIVASKGGYFAEGNGAFVDTNATSRARVNSGERAHVAFKLVQESALRGQITNSNNAATPNIPVQNLSVQILELGYDGAGRATWKMRAQTTTNERGEYKFTRLTPGDYYIRTAHVAMPSQTSTFTVANASMTYYPGTIESGAAAPITLKDGEERIADFKESTAGAHTIRGRVIWNPPDSPDTRRVQIGLLPDNPTAPLDSIHATSLIDSVKQTEGNFEIVGVRSGAYELTVHTEIYKRTPSSNAVTPIAYESRVAVQVRDNDVENVNVTVSPGVEVRGRLVIEGDGQGIRLPEERKPPTSPPNPGEGFTIRTIPAGQLPHQLSIYLIGKDDRQTAAVATNAEGTTFAVRNISPGKYVIKTLALTLGPWSTYVADVRAGGRSILVDGITIGAESPEPLDVIVRSDAGIIQGAVATAATPQTPVLLVVVPSPQLRRNLSLYSSLTAYGGGNFTLKGIPPGEYKVFAWEGFEGISGSNPHMNPNYIARYEARGVSVKVLPNGTTADLKVPLIRKDE